MSLIWLLDAYADLGLFMYIFDSISFLLTWLNEFIIKQLNIISLADNRFVYFLENRDSTRNSSLIFNDK